MQSNNRDKTMNTIKRLLRLAAVSTLAAVIVGCAHPISMTPDIAAMEPVADQVKSTKAVGIYISPSDKQLAVETPGGGGDKITYFPYRDMETALYKMLSNVYRDVTVLTNPNDQAVIQKAGLSFVFVPRLVTNSSSPSMLTWPPTKFSVELTCKVLDTNGKEIGSKRVLGDGAAEFDEFKRDFSLSAKRASLDAIKKMQTELIGSRELR
jgi:hypothetical protein